MFQERSLEPATGPLQLSSSSPTPTELMRVEIQNSNRSDSPLNQNLYNGDWWRGNVIQLTNNLIAFGMRHLIS